MSSVGPGSSPPLLARLWNRLYVRIWLGVVLTVAVLTLLVGWVWRMTVEPPLREMVVRDEVGQVIGQGLPRHGHGDGANPHTETPRNEADEASASQSPNGPGPEFTVIMENGQTLHVHLPRPPRSPWSRLPFGFFWSLVLVGVAVALATYPIVRKLTRRLELLRQGVEQWGAGDLSVRVPVRGQDEVAFLAERFNFAAQRIETLMAQQQATSAGILARKVGTRQQVIVDSVVAGGGIGRSRADAPEIDGSVRLTSRRPLRVGDIVTAKIDSAGPYDLAGSVV